MNPLWPRRRARLSRPLGELIERKRRRTPVLLRFAKIVELRDAHQCRYAPSQGNSRQRLASVDSRLGGWQPRHARHETGDEGVPLPPRPLGRAQSNRAARIKLSALDRLSSLACAMTPAKVPKKL